MQMTLQEQMVEQEDLRVYLKKRNPLGHISPLAQKEANIKQTGICFLDIVPKGKWKTSISWLNNTHSEKKKESKAVSPSSIKEIIRPDSLL